jgi:hypothetical protein
MEVVAISELVKITVTIVNISMSMIPRLIVIFRLGSFLFIWILKDSNHFRGVGLLLDEGCCDFTSFESEGNA